MRIPMTKTRVSLKSVILVCCLTFIARYVCVSLKQESHHNVPQTTLSTLTSSPIHDGVQEKRKSRIGFLKVHKAASSTLQNIFIRFGLANNSTFVLPIPKRLPEYSHVISVLRTMTTADIQPPPPDRTFDILCHHVIYNRQAWKSVLPNDAVIIGSLREPTSHFRSVLQYFRPQYITQIASDHKVETFLDNPYQYEVTVPYSVTNNRLSFEFGVSETIILKKDIGAFKRYLNEVLDKEFHLVIVLERFDESLVVMKRKLNWTLHDIIYIEKNYHLPFDYDLTFDDNFVPLLKKHNALDYLLYEFFKKKLDDQIAVEREYEFDEEVLTFSTIRERVVNFCRSKSSWGRSIMMNATPWNTAFKWTRDECSFLMQDEISLTKTLRQKQYPYSVRKPYH